MKATLILGVAMMIAGSGMAQAQQPGTRRTPGGATICMVTHDP